MSNKLNMRLPTKSFIIFIFLGTNYIYSNTHKNRDQNSMSVYIEWRGTRVVVGSWQVNSLCFYTILEFETSNRKLIENK